MNTQERLDAITKADPCYKIAKIGDLRAKNLIQNGELDNVHVLQGDMLSDDTFITYYQDGDYVDLHEAHNDYDQLVDILYDFLELDC